ncbi:hypothetical protein [Streptomyces sp. NPDC055607]
MTDAIHWREAVKNRDTVALRRFTCTTKREGKRHPPPHEDQVQRYFRQHAIAAANRSRDQGNGGRLMIAEDSLGIAAAYTHQRLTNLPPKVALSLGFMGAGEVTRELCFLAVATRHRSKGGALADDAVARALYDILDCEPEAERIHVFGQVDYNNKASMKMLERFNFRQLTQGVPPPTGDQRLGWWLHIIDPPR